MSELTSSGLWQAWHTEVPGKWVLAGEHAVLRGSSAVALPHPEFTLRARFTPSTADQALGGFKVVPPEAEAIVLELLSRFTTKPSGLLEFESSIPMGAGLGSSAALCVALTQWLSVPIQVGPEEQFEFARNLEHSFHGRSSGMDVAAILAGEPILFTLSGGPRKLGIKRLPKFTFHDTGLRAQTRACIQKVDQGRSEAPDIALKTDTLMGLAAESCAQGLIRFQQGRDEEALDLLTRGINQAHQAFTQWQLVPPEAQSLIEELKEKGALAAKLTGAGGGGFVVALWA